MARKKILQSKVEVPLLKLNLGSGQSPKEEGWLNVDIIQTENVDVVCDLSKGTFPWKDNSVGEVKSSHFLEHLDGGERIHLFNELYRILTPEIKNSIGEVLCPPGKAQFVVPYYSSMRSIQDPTHKWPPLCEASFLYFNKQWRETNKLDHYNIEADFNFSYGHAWDIVWGQKNSETRQFANMHYNNVISDLVVNLEVVKEPLIVRS